MPEKSKTEEKPKRKRKPDELYEIFAAAFLSWSGGAPYSNRQPDFVQLARLRRSVKESANPEWLTPARFSKAVANYFGSSLAKPTLADLSARFANFYRSRCDRFGHPIAEPVGATSKTMPGEFVFCSEACQNQFARIFTACDDCENRLRLYLGNE